MGRPKKNTPVVIKESSATTRLKIALRSAMEDAKYALQLVEGGADEDAVLREKAQPLYLALTNSANTIRRRYAKLV